MIGFWSWPEPGVGSFLEVADKTKLYESALDWSQKIPKLFWRGALMVEIRKTLVLLAKKYRWGAVSDIDWTDKGDVSRRLLTPEEHCQYKYLAHVEGWAYSGRLKYIMQCRSVIVAHEMEYVQHFHHLIDADDRSPAQNMVIVPGTEWKTLPKVMDRLIANDTRALEIATNSFDHWRRYLNPAATACYWRRSVSRLFSHKHESTILWLTEYGPRLFKTWATLQRYEVQLFKDTVSYESFMSVSLSRCAQDAR